MAATGSPTNRTTSMASSGASIAWFMFGVIGLAAAMPAAARSAPV